jgi:uncharacterized protein (DUF1697 family)
MTSKQRVYIALLRAVNVGGTARIKMDALRALCADLGLQNVQTVLQTGNIVFTAPAGSVLAVGERLESAIEASHGFRPTVIIRSQEQLSSAANFTPFNADQMVDPARVVIMFLSATPDGDAIATLQQAHKGPETIVVRGPDAYLYYPDGIGRSKLTTALIESRLKVRGTGRNWNTVTQLAHLAAETSTRL